MDMDEVIALGVVADRIFFSQSEPARQGLAKQEEIAAGRDCQLVNHIAFNLFVLFNFI